MEEYRRIRLKHSILDVCKTPELAAEVTLQPIERFPFDAAMKRRGLELLIDSLAIRTVSGNSSAGVQSCNRERISLRRESQHV